MADRIRRRATPGRYSDTHAHTICQDTILPTIEETLRERIAACDPSLLYKLAVRLNAACARNLRRSNQIMHSLAGPWAANWHDAARDGDRSATMTSLQVLFEAALADPPAGDRTVDALDLGELAALAELLALAAAVDYGYERDLHGLQVDINDDGIFVVQGKPVIADQRDLSSDPPLDIDLAAYHRAQLDHLIAVAAKDPWTIDDLAQQASQGSSRLPHAVQQRDRGPFERLATFAEPSLLKADELLACGWGTGSTASRLCSAPPPTGQPTGRVSPLSTRTTSFAKPPTGLPSPTSRSDLPSNYSRSTLSNSSKLVPGGSSTSSSDPIACWHGHCR
ncbi:hypothetical protein [Micromonospora chalcea]|uniref:hypothetical protein n=1 Tax=Micromonospora chalcea TaxID=1874 RepID=UPI0033311CFA